MDNTLIMIQKNDIQPQNEIWKCEYCNKVISRRDNLLRHYKCCKHKSIISEQNIVNQQNINNSIINNTIINGNVKNDNRKIINLIFKINGVGCEKIKDIPYYDVKEFFSGSSGGRSILNYIKTAYFNRELPENHSFCTTNIKSKYLNVYNNETKAIELKRKKYFFDGLLRLVTNRIKELYEEYYDEKFIQKNQNQILDILDANNNFKEKVFNDKLVKELFNEIELLSYNDKRIVLATWQGKNNYYFLIKKLVTEISSTNIYNKQKFNKYNLIIENLFLKIKNLIF
jgi:hypothetical protein